MTGIAQGEKQVHYHYDAAGMRTATQLFSQGSEVVTTSQTYDGMGRLTQIKHGDIAQYDFSWDAANRITAMNDADYGYDKTSQLVSAEYEKLPEELYEYDANGNRKAFETGKNNQLLSDGVFDYKYDDEGNRIAKQSKDSLTCYEWDHRNRLIRVIDNGKSVEYAYDYQNRLVKRNDELFVHDGWQIACSLKNGKVEHRYLWGATQDELLAMDDMWTLRDHLNTVRKVVDAKGAVVSELEYNAFGVLMNATGEKPLFRYTGKMFDDTTGLQWNINRWYDAKVGRWISEDPIGFEAGDENLYRYVANGAVNSLDRFGLQSGWISDEFVFKFPIQYRPAYLVGLSQFTTHYEIKLPYRYRCSKDGIPTVDVGTAKGNLLGDIDTFVFPGPISVQYQFVPNTFFRQESISCPSNTTGEKTKITVRVSVYEEVSLVIPWGTTIYEFPGKLIGSGTGELIVDCCIVPPTCNNKANDDEEEPDFDYDCYACDTGGCNGKYDERVPKGSPNPNPMQCFYIGPC
jgi:RHS repeat-associated protein